jgi:hypothetical protein
MFKTMAPRNSSRLNKGKGITSDGPSVVTPHATSTVDPAITKLIADSIAAAMTQFESRVEARNNSHSGGNGNGTDSGTGKIHTPGARESGNKRKLHNSRNNPRRKGRTNKDNKRRLVQSCITTFPDRKQYTGSLPLCTKCNYHHNGNCSICFNCQKPGHLSKNCRSPPTKTGACYKCGSTEHYRNKCPKLAGGSGNKYGKAFVMGVRKVKQEPTS